MNVQDQKLEGTIADLQQQLDVAKQRNKELDAALAHERRAYENTVIERDAEGRNAEAAERQLDAANQRHDEAVSLLRACQKTRESLGDRLDEALERAEAAERNLATARSETIQECADWITETELALPIAWHIGTKDELVKKFALCLASCLRMETLDKHCYLCSEETLDSARRDKVLAQVEQPQRSPIPPVHPMAGIAAIDRKAQAKLPGEDPDGEPCQCSACVVLRARAQAERTP